MYLLCRGFIVETCIVVQHVGGGSTNSPRTSPVAKKPCPPIQVIMYSITSFLNIVTKYIEMVINKIPHYILYRNTGLSIITCTYLSTPKCKTPGGGLKTWT